MKLSISLREDEVAAIDAYAQATGMTSRSAVIQRAIAGLRSSELETAYGQAWDDWEADDHQADWDATAGDGLSWGARASR